MNAAIKAVRQAMSNTEASTAIVMNLASLMTSGPDHLGDAEIENFATLLLATREGRKAPAADGNDRLNNLLFLVVEKVNDLPTWLYLNNPVHQDHLDSPSQPVHPSGSDPGPPRGFL